MRKSILALAAVSTVFALTAAGAAGYNITVDSAPLSISSSGTDSVTTNACPLVTSVDTAFTLTGLNISSITVTTDDATCTAPAQVTLSNAGGTTNIVYNVSALVAGVGTATPASGSGWNLTPSTGNGTVSSAAVVLYPGS